MTLSGRRSFALGAFSFGKSRRRRSVSEGYVQPPPPPSSRFITDWTGYRDLPCVSCKSQHLVDRWVDGEFGQRPWYDCRIRDF